jgi:hypothetical protein
LLRFLVRTWISKEDGQRPVYDLWCRFLLVGPVCFALYLYTSDCTIALKECAFSTASRFEFRVSHCAACGSHLLVAFLTMPAILSGSSHQTCPLSSLKHFCRGVCVCVCVCVWACIRWHILNAHQMDTEDALNLLQCKSRRKHHRQAHPQYRLFYYIADRDIPLIEASLIVANERCRVSAIDLSHHRIPRPRNRTPSANDMQQSRIIVN